MPATGHEIVVRLRLSISAILFLYSRIWPSKPVEYFKKTKKDKSLVATLRIIVHLFIYFVKADS